MEKRTDSYTARERRWAKRLFDASILPDNNPAFIRELLKVADEMGTYPAFKPTRLRFIAHLKHDCESYEDAHKLILKAKEHFRQLSGTVSEQPNSSRAKKITGKFIVDVGGLDDLTKNLLVKLEEANRLLEQVKQRSDFLLKRQIEFEKKLSANLAAFIWALKYEVAHEISRRNRLGLRLNPMRHRDGKHRPSYRNQWQLVADLYKTFYEDSWDFSIKQLKEINGKLKHPVLHWEIFEMESEREKDQSKPFGVATIRRFAYRHRGGTRSHKKP